MNICVNALPLRGLVTGVGRYVRSLYAEMAGLPGVSVQYFLDPELLARMPEQARPGAWIKRTDWLWKLPDALVTALRAAHWLRFEHRLRRALRTSGATVYHETAFTPSNIRRSVPQVFTLYDLSLLCCRDMHPRERVWFADLFFKRRLPEATHIIAISSYVRQEAMELLDIPGDRITAIPLAPAPHFGPRDPGECAAVRRKYGLPERYFLFVGTLEPRKNLDALVTALRLGREPHHLVITGWKGWGDKQWEAALSEPRLASRIHPTGYVDDADLPGLYAGATALIYLSHYEGFGLPVVEAMACGCPVVCSNVSSLPEAGGDAAWFIEPRDVDALAQAMDTLAGDEARRAAMRARGLRHAASLTWRRNAEATLAVFRRAAGEAA